MSTVRRRRSYCDAHTTNIDSSDAVVQGQPRIRPPGCNLRRNPLERPQRQRLIRFIFQVMHASSDVVIANHAEERRDRAVTSARVAAFGDSRDQRVERERR